MPTTHLTHYSPSNKGKLIGQKPPLKLQEVWSIRVRLEIANRYRDLALFNLAIDSKLRSCDLVKLKVQDIAHGARILKRAMVIQQKTKRPVQFEITPQTQQSLLCWIGKSHLLSHNYLFPSRSKPDGHLSTRQYARVVKSWLTLIGLLPED